MQEAQAGQAAQAGELPPRALPAMQARAQAEARLIERAVAQRDHEAFAELLQPYRDAAYHLALRILHDPGLAEDALQEVYIRAWKNLAKLDAGQPIGGWLLRIAANESIRLTRSKRSRSNAESWSAQMNEAPPETPPAERLAKEEDLGLLKTALARLGLEDQRLLALYYAAELSQQNIGAALGLPQQVVSYKLLKAMEKVRAQLKVLAPSTAFSMLAAEHVRSALCSGPAVPAALVDKLHARLKSHAQPASGLRAPQAAFISLTLLAVAGTAWWLFSLEAAPTQPRPAVSAVAVPESSTTSAEPAPVRMAWDFAKQDLSGLELLSGRLQLAAVKGKRLAEIPAGTAAAWLLPEMPGGRAYRVTIRYQNTQVGPHMMGVGMTDGQRLTRMRSLINKPLKSSHLYTPFETEWVFVDQYMLVLQDDRFYQLSELEPLPGRWAVLHNGFGVGMERMSVESLTDAEAAKARAQIQNALKDAGAPKPWADGTPVEAFRNMSTVVPNVK